MDPKKRSNIVVLTLVGLPFGAMALGSVMPAGQEMRRNLYPDRGACVRDYSAQQCEPHSGSSTGGGGGYHGPYYASRIASGAAGDPGAGRTGQITRTETSVRGGFGSFGRAMRAVG
jgi:hypothetical protein